MKKYLLEIAVDILGLLSLLICFICLIIGYVKPKFTAYFVLITTPILSPGRLVLVPSNTLPLEYVIFAFALSFGVTLSPTFRRIFKSLSSRSFSWIYGVLLMIVLLAISSDTEYITSVFFLDVPTYFVGIVIPLFIVNSFKDLTYLIKILVWQGAIIGVLALLAYLDIFRFTYLLRQTVPDYDLNIVKDAFRAGAKRVHGLDGSASQTASRLVFLFFLSFWYSLQRSKFLYFVPMILIFMGLILLQTRAAFVSLFIGLVYLTFVLSYRNLINFKFIKAIYSSVILFIITIIFTPFLWELFKDFIYLSLLPSFVTNDISVDVKIERIPLAIDFATQRLFLGYGSREFVYKEIMHTDDLPTPLIYLLSGGVSLLLTFLYVYLYPIYKTWILKKGINKNDRRFLVFISAALLAGFIMTLTNWLETHRMIMVMVFIGSLKYLSILKNNKYHNFYYDNE